MNTLKLQIVSLDGVVYSEESVRHVNLKSLDGEITILANHAPLVTPLKEGVVNIKKGESVDRVETSRGVVEVRPKSEVVILVNTAKVL
jgi:F-type H+-transporting ATPase subunit epsilon